ncbi:class I SAM-dependent methyltransferase [Natrinema altunense]|uniref:class I SAM-dependent methyltransferase n=1 Tax=Natrinema altunense TaxID=222984 RepID=UPI000677A386|nr:class I SAM-dependent methyltransferase [Natrinema altunense]
MGVENPNYMDIIGIVDETNRPPGGIESVTEAARRTLLTVDDEVLEVGTSTGFTAIELSRLIGCSVTAIDINEESLAEAQRRAEELNADENISFEQEDATDLPYDDETFDVVFVGNVTSYVGDTEAALEEYRRVLRSGGFLVAVPMYYVRQPDEELLADVRDAIGTYIDVTTRDHWREFFDQSDLRLYHDSEYEFDFVPESAVEAYADEILEQSDLSEFDGDDRKLINETYREYLLLFRENLQHLRYSLLVYRKDPGYEPELFTSSSVNN